MSKGRRAVSGADRLNRRLHWLQRQAGERAAHAVGKTAEEVRGKAREALRRAPGNLPRLAETVEVADEGADRAVIVRHPAAPYVELGTRHMPPRPFLQPAADAARGSLRRRIGDMIARLLRARP